MAKPWESIKNHILPIKSIPKPRKSVQHDILVSKLIPNPSETIRIRTLSHQTHAHLVISRRALAKI